MEETISISRDDIYRQFEEFFSTVKKNQLEELAGSYPQKQSLEVDYVELQRFNTNLADDLVIYPDKLVAIAEEAMRSLNTHA